MRGWERELDDDVSDVGVRGESQSFGVAECDRYTVAQCNAMQMI